MSEGMTLADARRGCEDETQTLEGVERFCSKSGPPAVGGDPACAGQVGGSRAFRFVVLD
jgi:hypothetical protein